MSCTDKLPLLLGFQRGPLWRVSFIAHYIWPFLVINYLSYQDSVKNYQLINEWSILSRTSDITQLAAYSENMTFSSYIFPFQAISKEASEVTKIFVNGNQMFHNHNVVQYKLPHEALMDFIQFLASFSRKCILVGHNIKRFDSHVLYNQLHFYNMWNEFCLHVCGFFDTLDLFKSVVRGMSSYSQMHVWEQIQVDHIIWTKT